MITYIRILIATIFLICLPASCDSLNNNELEDCGTKDPLEDLAWLKQKKQVMELNMGIAGSQIIQYTYKNNTVFWIDECYSCADNMISVYNCAGEVICQFGGIAGINTCIDFETEATDSTMLYNNVQN